MISRRFSPRVQRRKILAVRAIIREVLSVVAECPLYPPEADISGYNGNVLHVPNTDIPTGEC